MSVLCRCPHCNEPVQITEEWAGQAVSCPHCRGVFATPPKALIITPLPSQQSGRSLLQWARDKIIGMPEPPKPFRCPLCGTGEAPVVKQGSDHSGWGIVAALVTGSIWAPLFFGKVQPTIVCRHCGKTIKK